MEPENATAVGGTTDISPEIEAQLEEKFGEVLMSTVMLDLIFEFLAENESE